MPYEFVDIGNFTGGMNTVKARYALADNELADARDAIVRGDGKIRRRGGYDLLQLDGNPMSFSTSTQRLIAIGTHVYNNDARGTLAVVADAGSDTSDIMWLEDGATSWDVLFQMPVAATKGEIGGGSTRPPRDKNDDSMNLNARYNASVIATDKFVLSFKYDADGIDFFTPAADEGNKSFRSVGNLAEFVYIAGTVDFLVGKSPDDAITDVDAWPYFTHDEYHYGYEHTVTVAGYTFLAGGKFPMHLYWSEEEDCHHWETRISTGGTDLDRRPVDFIHIPTPKNKPIKKLSAFNNRLYVIKEDSVHSVDVLGVDRFKVDYKDDVGTIDGRSVAQYESYLLWANTDGVYQFDGNQAINISEDKIGTDWRQDLSAYAPTWTVAGAVFGDYYVVSVIDASSVNIRTWMVHIPSRAWVKLNNLPLRMAYQSIDSRFTLGVLRSTNGSQYIAKLDTMITNHDQGDAPDEGIVDLSSNGPIFRVETGAITLGNALRKKMFRHVLLDWVSESGASVTLVSEFAKNLEASTWTTISPSFPSVWPGRTVRRTIDAISPAINLRFSELAGGGGASRPPLTIHGISVAYEELQQGRV